MNKLINPKTYITDQKTPYVSYNAFENVDFCVAGFSTRYGGVSTGYLSSMNLGFGRGDSEENVRENFRLMGESAGFSIENVCLPNQCHTREVRVVNEADRGSGIFSPKVAYPVDSQITNIPGITLICYGADCVPVYFCDEEHKAIGLAHAGWKGTFLNIVEAAITKMNSTYETEPRNLKVVIGPSICMNCYEVSEDVASQFKEKYKNDINIVKPIENDKYLLNLWQANYVNLINAGVPSQNITISDVCTKCNPDMFFSHRYHGTERGANAAFMYIK